VIDDGIFALLTEASVVHALIGTRMYPVELPSDAQLPAATFQLVSNVPAYTLDDGVPYRVARLQIESWSPSKLAAAAVDAAVLSVLDEFAGELGNGLTVTNAWVESGPIARFEPDSRLFRVQTDWKIQYSAG
jgi:hypothetical protein